MSLVRSQTQLNKMIQQSFAVLCQDTYRKVQYRCLGNCGGTYCLYMWRFIVFSNVLDYKFLYQVIGKLQIKNRMKTALIVIIYFYFSLVIRTFKHSNNLTPPQQTFSIKILCKIMVQYIKSRIFFTLLQKIPLQQAMKASISQNYVNQLLEKHRKQLNQTLYLIQITQQKESWVLLKTGRQCLQLFNDIFSPLSSHEQLNKFVKRIEDIIINIIPHPQNHALFSHTNLIDYLNILGSRPQILENQSFSSFIEYNNVFERFVYRKFIMVKKNGGRYKEGCCSMGRFWTQWKKRQVSIQYNGISYKNEFGQIKQYLPFSQGLEYFFGREETAMDLGIILVSNHRRLVLQTQNIQDFIMFLYLLKKKTIESPYFNINRFNSFAPPRQFVNSQFYIDGKEYFQALADSIQKAKKSIYMTGWMISPQFLLKRQNEKISLIDLIAQRVKQGVQVNILVYLESSFLSNDSAWVKQKFQSLGNKVKVIRHPTGKLPILWSHHSKIVIIDKEQAFFGGLDLCYGRYDCSLHEIFPQKSVQLYPGIEYNNCRIRDIDNVRKFNIDHIDKRHPRLPWHDICQSVKGLIVSDFVHHFVEIWNFASYENRQVLNKEIISSPTDMQIKTIHNIKSTKESEAEMKSDTSQKQRKTGNKFLQAISGKFEEVKNMSKESIAVLKRKFYPEKKIKLEELYRKKKIYAVKNNFQSYVADIHEELSELPSRQFTQSDTAKQNRKSFQNNNRKQSIDNYEKYLQENQSKSTRKLKSLTFNKDSIPSLTGINVDENYMINLKKLQIETNEILPEVDQDIDSEEEGPAKIQQNKPFTVTDFRGPYQSQILRSVGNWSIGCSIEKTQFSIHIAYLQLISQAQHYIYIQNQFFISSTPQTKQVKNEICNAIYRRIKKAVEKKQNFKVYIMLPLLPAFAGDVELGDCTFLRMIMEWHYKTIKGLIKRIKNLGVESDQYIKFLGLRTYGLNNQGNPMTQIIYVHSKLIIVDDKCTIIGSANINDRSLLGDRDSQIAVVTYGTDLVESQMNGQKILVSQNIKNFRIRLWKQHYGFQNQILEDPASPKLWAKVTQVSDSNTKIYRKLFGCYPDNEMKTLRELKQIKGKSSTQKYQEIIKQIRGNVTVYPFHFLQQQPIPTSFVSKEYYIPTQCLI